MAHQDISASAAVASAKELFWRRGYEDASIEDVVKATGLNRYAIYSAFGGKLDLFLAVLDAYYNERKGAFFQSLNSSDTSPLDAVRTAFELSIQDMAEHGAGCLICNVATDIAQDYDVVFNRIENYQAEILNAYIDALTRAQANGELNGAITPEDGAALLIALKLGLGVHAKTGSSRDEMLQILNATLTLLGKSPSP